MRNKDIKDLIAVLATFAHNREDLSFNQLFELINSHMKDKQSLLGESYISDRHFIEMLKDIYRKSRLESYTITE